MARELVEPRDAEVVLEEPVARARRLELVAGEHFEEQVKAPRELRATHEPAGHLGKNLTVTKHRYAINTNTLEHKRRNNRVEVGEYQNIIHKVEKANEVIVGRAPAFSNPIGGHGMTA